MMELLIGAGIGGGAVFVVMLFLMFWSISNAYHLGYFDATKKYLQILKEKSVADGVTTQ